MANKRLRDIDEVNGWKVIHPHSGVNIFYAIMTFIFSGLPLAFLFIPIVSEVPVDFVTGLTGLDIFKYFIDFLTAVFTSLSTGGAIVPPHNNYIDTIVACVNPVMRDAVGYTFVALGGVLILFMVFSVILLITAVVHLSKGYLRRPGKVKRIAITEFVFSLLFFLAMLFIYFTFKAQMHTELFIWLTAIPVGVSLMFSIFFSIYHYSVFKDSVLESELEIQNNETTVEHVAKVHEVKKVSYEKSSTLPQNLTSIGGHEFAENQSLIVANIPLGVEKLGAGAFANCLHLQVVSIPDSVKEIGFNCFFNCVELERINYAGTKEQWRRIRRGSNWLAKAKTSEVVCLDGTIIVNPYH